LVEVLDVLRGFAFLDLDGFELGFRQMGEKGKFW
jgi:hypothetical protein